MPEPELSLQRDREGSEGWMTQSWVVGRVRRAAPQDGVVVTGEKAATGELRHSSSL